MTSLAATFQPGDVDGPARVLLQVTGAPTLVPPYESDFGSSVDGLATEAVVDPQVTSVSGTATITRATTLPTTPFRGTVGG